MAEADRSALLPGLEFQVAPLLEHLTCPVCMEVMRNATITVPCAHTFCGQCIRQALNLKHECPICKAPAQAENLMPNRQCDTLIDTLEREKAAAAAKYFERLAGPPVDSQLDSEIGEGRCDKVETAFRRHHQHAMLVFQSTAEEVRRAFAKRSRHMEDVDAGGPQEQKKAELERLRLAEEACINQLAADYENHLKEAMAPLPVLGELAPTIHVDICTQTSLKTIAIRVTKTMFLDDLRREVLQELAKADDPLVGLPAEGVRVVAYPPGTPAGGDLARGLPRATVVAGGEEDEMVGALESCPEHPQQSSGEAIELDESRPLIHQGWQLLTGSRIVFCGSDESGADGVQLKLVSEVSTECFRTAFVKGSHEVCDYYRCNTCAMKWICSACARGPCHAGQGHEVVAFALKHKATYGACYCKKKKGQCCLTC